MKKLICALAALLLLFACAAAENPVPYIPMADGEPSEIRGVMPVTPADGLSLVSPACFTGADVLPVYALPDEGSSRAENGEAVCPLDRVTRIFGRQGGWLLIEYAVTEEQARVGWIRYDTEARTDWSGTVYTLELAAQSACTAEETPLTDDPQQSMETVLTLAAGQEVTYLTSWDDWAYVRAGDTCGFVRADALIFRLHGLRTDITHLLAGTWIRTSGKGWRTLSFTSGGMAYDGDATLAAYAAVYDIEQGLELVLTDDHSVTTAYELTFFDMERISLTDGESVITYERARED